MFKTLSRIMTPNIPTALTVRAVLICAAMLSSSVASANDVSERLQFKRVPYQFIAALGDPDANSGSGAETWGHWPTDPGTTGVWLRLFPVLQATGGYGPGNWKFDTNDWWLDENGLIMEPPEFPLSPGQYLVTGEREVTTVLTVHPDDENGHRRWELANDASLFDVTHMPCRSARYTPLTENSCSPANADKSHFVVPPGSEMPAVPGCAKQDYSVLIVIGVPAESSE